MMKAHVKWVDGLTMVGESPSGHAVVMDGPEAFGGHNLGTRPMEMVLLGLGGCSLVDVLVMLEKARQQVTDVDVQIEAERSAEIPKVFTRIHMQFVVTGKGLDERHVDRAVRLSAEKYCSVSMMLNKSAEMSHGFEIHEG